MQHGGVTTVKSWESKVPPPKLRFPQEIAGPNSRPKIKGNQWVFIVPDHKGPRLFLGGFHVALGGTGALDSHGSGWKEMVPAVGAPFRPFGQFVVILGRVFRVKK